MAFKPHMTYAEADKLQAGDEVDHRQLTGLFIKATIIQKCNNGILKLGYNINNRCECSYIDELHRIAIAGSISQRPAHRLTYLRKGLPVDIHISGKGWRKAQVIHLSNMSGQIQIEYMHESSDAAMPIKMHRWVHLDNKNEIDHYGVHTSKQELDHLPQSLETNRAYLNAPNEIKPSCAQRIIETVYGGMENILPILIANGSTSELHKMQQIINTKTVEYHEKAKVIHNNIINKENESMNEEKSNETIKISSLSQVSRDAIIHICSFLSREDIKSFKLTSFRNGIVCLRHMTKVNVGIFNTNEMINDLDEKYVDTTGLIIKSNFEYHRYPATVDYLSLRTIWQEKYEIPLSKQFLLLMISKEHSLFTIHHTQELYRWDAKQIRTFPNSKFILFDNRNTIQFDEIINKPKKMELCKKIEKDSSIVFVKWYDIHFQEITPLQFVMGKREDMTVGRLTKYIEKEFIVTTEQQKIWYSKLMKYFKKMDNIAPNHQKLIVFAELESMGLVQMNNPIATTGFLAVRIFQLNPTHPAFTKYKFTSIKEKYNLLTQ